MATSGQTADMANNISKLKIDPAKASRGGQKSAAAKNKVADSWDDEDVSSGADDEEDSRPSTAGQGPKEGTTAPPPTPISPNYHVPQSFSSIGTTLSPDDPVSSPGKRPEKTDAVARRMIAGSLGLRLPKQTEEQKAYDKAMREKERKKRDEERAAAKKQDEEREKARQAMWED
jgi:hypothetical protein